jgi:DNA-binding response OmpR family regulator
MYQGSTKPLALIADDDADFRQAVAHALSAEGLDVVTARTGRQALDLTLSLPVDVVLLDHRMPELNGGDTHDALRVRGYRGPVILVTGRDDRDPSGTERTPDYELRKPFELDALVEVVRLAMADGRCP